MSSSFRRDRDSKADGQTFKDDLKSIFSEAGVENRPVVFIVDKVNAVDEGERTSRTVVVRETVGRSR